MLVISRMAVAVLAASEEVPGWFRILPILFLVSILWCLGSTRRLKKAYYDSLRKLKKQPNNPDFREEAVRLGRKYAAKAKDWRGRSTFDETMLTNDLFAACARATTGEATVAKVEVTNPEALPGLSVAEEIDKLEQLFLTNVITMEEFERGKTLFLGAPVDKAASAVELLQNMDALRKKGVLSQSEFNMKKWEILSERLLPGKRSVADL